MVKQSIRWFSTGLFTLLVYLVTSSVLGAISAVLHHIRSFRFSDLVVVKKDLITLRYSWSAIVHPNPITDFAFLMTGLFFLWDGFRTFRIAYDQRRKYKIRDKYASHGTARWQTRSEVQAFYEKDNRGYLLGDFKKTTYQPLSLTAFNNAKIDSYAVHPFASELNQQYVIFGPPGSKKTTGYILPNLFHLGQQGLSIVATDPKGELYQHTGEYLRELGYNVVVLDYIHFQYGSRQNYLQYIFEEKQYAELASMFLNATRNEGDKRDFWEGKAQELLTALIGFVHQAYGDKGTFTDIYNLLGLVLGDRDHMLRLLDQHNVKGAPKLLLKSIIAQAGSENLMSNIVGTLTEKLNLFTLSNVRGHTATTDYDLNRIAKEKTAVFVFIDVADVTYAPLVSVFWSSIFNIFYKIARENGGKLPVNVAPLIDEMANIGKINGFDTKLTTMRSLGIYPMMIWHSYPQLKLKYGETYADVFLASCDTHVLLACNDLQTAELFSKELGDTTIETHSKRGAKSAAAKVNNESNQFTGRRLMQPSELIKLDRRFSIVMQNGRPPVLLNKVQYRYWESQVCKEATIEQLPSYFFDEGETHIETSDIPKTTLTTSDFFKETKEGGESA